MSKKFHCWNLISNKKFRIFNSILTSLKGRIKQQRKADARKLFQVTKSKNTLIEQTNAKPREKLELKPSEHVDTFYLFYL